MKTFLTSLFLWPAAVLAQVPDSSKTTVSQEDARLTRAEISRFVSYITRANVQEKTLVKVGVWPTRGLRPAGSQPEINLGVDGELSVERKLTPSVSLLVGLDFATRYTAYERFSVPIVMNPGSVNPSYLAPDRIFTNDFSVKTALRYYYGMAGRIRRGTASNNFSGNYLSLQASRGLVTGGRTATTTPVPARRSGYAPRTLR